MNISMEKMIYIFNMIIKGKHAFTVQSGFCEHTPQLSIKSVGNETEVSVSELVKLLLGENWVPG